MYFLTRWRCIQNFKLNRICLNLHGVLKSAIEKIQNSCDLNFFQWKSEKNALCVSLRMFLRICLVFRDINWDWCMYTLPQNKLPKTSQHENILSFQPVCEHFHNAIVYCTYTNSKYAKNHVYLPELELVWLLRSMKFTYLHCILWFIHLYKQLKINNGFRFLISSWISDK